MNFERWVHHPVYHEFNRWIDLFLLTIVWGFTCVLSLGLLLIPSTFTLSSSVLDVINDSASHVVGTFLKRLWKDRVYLLKATLFSGLSVLILVGYGSLVGTVFGSLTNRPLAWLTMAVLVLMGLLLFTVILQLMIYHSYFPTHGFRDSLRKTMLIMQKRRSMTLLSSAYAFSLLIATYFFIPFVFISPSLVFVGVHLLLKAIYETLHREEMERLE